MDHTTQPDTTLCPALLSMLKGAVQSLSAEQLELVLSESQLQALTTMILGALSLKSKNDYSDDEMIEHLRDGGLLIFDGTYEVEEWMTNEYEGELFVGDETATADQLRDCGWLVTEDEDDAVSWLHDNGYQGLLTEDEDEVIEWLGEEGYYVFSSKKAPIATPILEALEALVSAYNVDNVDVSGQ
jgi:hypothetical protein